MDNNRTQHFSVVKEELDVHMILERVYEALQEKGYNQIGRASCRERVSSPV